MKFEVNKCRKLHNARTRAENKKHGNPSNEGTLKQQDIGALFYPENDDYHQVANLMGRVVKGDLKYIKIEWIKILTTITGVDYNFAFGQPSVFDREYKELIKNGKS